MRSIDFNAVGDDERVAALCDLAYVNGATAGQQFRDQLRDGRFVDEFERSLAMRRSEALKVLAKRAHLAPAAPPPRVPIDPAVLAEFEQYLRELMGRES